MVTVPAESNRFSSPLFREQLSTFPSLAENGRFLSNSVSAGCQQFGFLTALHLPCHMYGELSPEFLRVVNPDACSPAYRFATRIVYDCNSLVCRVAAV